MNDKYTIELPVVKKSIGNSGIFDVTKSSDIGIRDALEQIAGYFKSEFRYDNLQFHAEESASSCDKYQGFLFTESALDTMKDGDTVTPTRFIGGGCFRNRPFKGGPVWVLDWVWIHPFKRNLGLLTKHWNYFEEQFSDFRIEPPHSKTMEYFLSKRSSV